VTWFLRIVLAYVVFLILGLALLQFLAHRERDLIFKVYGGDHRYELAAYENLPIPRILGGSPGSGVVEVRDRSGRLIDSEEIQGARTVSGIHWEKYRVDFLYSHDGHVYQSSLDLPQ
jgi:hypothetical protein